MYGTMMYGGPDSRYGVAEVVTALRADVTGSTLLSALPYIRSLTGGFLSSVSVPSRTAADRPQYATHRLAIPSTGPYLTLHRVYQQAGAATILGTTIVQAGALRGAGAAGQGASVAGSIIRAQRVAKPSTGLIVAGRTGLVGPGKRLVPGNRLLMPTQSLVMASGAVSTGPEAFFVYDAGTDPRTFPTFSFTGDANRTQRDINNVPQPVAANVPRYQYYINGQPYFLVEAKSATNFLRNSTAPATQTISLAAGTYTLWMEGTGSVAVSGATDGAYGSATGMTAATWCTFTVTATQNVTVTVTGTVVRFQCESGKFPTSFIITTGAAVTRAGEVAKFTGTGLDVSAGAALYASYIERGAALATFAYLLCIGGDGMALDQGGGGAGSMTIEVPNPSPHVQSSIFASGMVAYGDTVECLGWTNADGTTQGVGTVNGVQKPMGTLTGTHAVSTDGNIYLCATSSAGNQGWAAFKRIVVDNSASKTLADMRIAHMAGAGQLVAAQATMASLSQGAPAGTILREATSIIGGAGNVIASTGSAAVTDVIVSPSSATVDAGSTVDLAAQAFDSDGQPVAGVTYAWTSSSPTVATVDSSGVVTGVVAGTCTVAAQVQGVSGLCTITVNPVTYASATFSTSTNQGDIGSADTGQPFIQLVDTGGQVVGGQLHVASADRALAVLDVSHADVTVECDVVDPTKEQGVAARVVDANNYLAAYFVSTSTVLTLMKSVAGVRTTLVTQDVGSHTGTIGLTVIGDSIIVSWNNATLFAHTDGDLATGTMGGCFGHGAVCDNLTITSPKYFKSPYGGTIYVAMNGTPNGSGTLADPVDLASVLRAGADPGTQIWVRGGQYVGEFDSYLTGTDAAPITLRRYQDERVIIDGYLHPHGAYTWYWGLECMFSEPTRYTSTPLSQPADLPRLHHQFAPAADAGPYNRLINCIIRDLADGTGDDNPQGTEITGCIIYNNGWLSTDRGHGHGIYTQNNTPTIIKKLYDNIVFNNFSTGITIHGNGDNLRGYDIQGGASFTSAAPTASTFGYQRNLEIEGSTEMGDITVNAFSSFQFAATSSALFAGNAGEITNYPLTITNCITRGVVELNGWQGLTVTGTKMTTGPSAVDAQSREFRMRVKPGLTYADYTIDTNHFGFVPAPQANLNVVDGSGVSFSTSDLATWQAHTGWDLNSTYQATVFTGADVVVQPNRYEAGRGHVICWNWDAVATLEADLSTILTVGDRFEVHHVYDLWGTPVAFGIYDGNPVSLPQTGYVAPQPVGWDTPVPSTAPDFNVFVVTSTSASAPIAAGAVIGVRSAVSADAGVILAGATIATTSALTATATVV